MTGKRTLRIVTRQSSLALWQAEYVKTQLESLHLNLVVSILGIKTEGDHLAHVSLAKLGGKGLFVKELEDYLLNDKADIAVHSLKDVPTDLPEGLTLGAILQREDPRDALVGRGQGPSPTGTPDPSPTSMGLLAGSVVGTSSLRRQAQISALQKDLQLKVLRGNVDTRLKKLDDGLYDAIILAASGLIRLGLRARISYTFDESEILPAVGQGALGLECSIKAREVLELIAPLHHADTGFCVIAERRMNKMLGGNCEVPVAGLATVLENGQLFLKGLVASLDGKTILREEATGDPVDAIKIGDRVAKGLLEKGAEEILRHI